VKGNGQGLEGKRGMGKDERVGKREEGKGKGRERKWEEEEKEGKGKGM
jgi:hypothetical protein